jgi:pimeloyl-ACP methyl ester carboxylesterase
MFAIPEGIYKRAGLLSAAAIVAATAFTLPGSLASASTSRTSVETPKPTIVLVHGAWADGSSWKKVTERLQADGYTVDVPPVPLRGVASDAAYLDAYLADVTGPIILVGHSYGGMVITNAAVGQPEVKALVYVDAYVPAQGDSLNSLTGALPGSILNQPAQNVFNIVSYPASVTGGAAGADLYVKPSVYGQAFANEGISPKEEAVLEAEQRPLSAGAVTEASGPPAWKTIPSWSVIGMQDQILPAAEQVAMDQRAGTHMLKVNAPHLSMVTEPDAVVFQILAAAKATA